MADASNDQEAVNNTLRIPPSPVRGSALSGKNDASFGNGDAGDAGDAPKVPYLYTRAFVGGVFFVPLFVLTFVLDTLSFFQFDFVKSTYGTFFKNTNAKRSMPILRATVGGVLFVPAIIFSVLLDVLTLGSVSMTSRYFKFFFGMERPKVAPVILFEPLGSPAAFPENGMVVVSLLSGKDHQVGDDPSAGASPLSSAGSGRSVVVVTAQAIGDVSGVDLNTGATVPSTAGVAPADAKGVDDSATGTSSDEDGVSSDGNDISGSWFQTAGQVLDVGSTVGGHVVNGFLDITGLRSLFATPKVEPNDLSTHKELSKVLGQRSAVNADDAPGQLHRSVSTASLLDEKKEGAALGGDFGGSSTSLASQYGSCVGTDSDAGNPGESPVGSNDDIDSMDGENRLPLTVR